MIEIPTSEDDWYEAVPVTKTGPDLGAAFNVKVSENGKTATVDTQAPGTDKEIIVAQITSLKESMEPVEEQAVIELVKLAIQFDGIRRQQTGDYSEWRRERQQERSSILNDVLLLGRKVSLVL